jgi:hypothetical protein
MQPGARKTALKPYSWTQRRASATADGTSCGATIPAPNMRSGASLQKSWSQSL